MIRHSEIEKNCPGYLYIEPFRHVEDYPSFTAEEFNELSQMLSIATNWIHQKFQPKKLYTITVSEAVPHIHFHIVPRYTDETKGLDYLKLALSSELVLNGSTIPMMDSVSKFFVGNKSHS